MFDLIRDLFRPRQRRARPSQPRPRPTFRPTLERLEDRTVPATLTVANTNDSGPGSLRAEVAAAQWGDTVEFSPSIAGQTITLTSGEITVPDHLTIDGQNNDITINGNNNSRIFEVANPDGGYDYINNLTLENGEVSDADGGAIQVDTGGGLSMSNVTIENCVALDNDGTGGNGGAIENDGSLALQLNNCTLTNNLASGNGGAIDSNGTQYSGTGGLNVTGGSLIGNSTTGGYGGAINTADPTSLTNVAFGGTGANQPNTAVGGGGAVNATGTESDPFPMQVSGCNFTNNQVNTPGQAGSGGAIRANAVNLTVMGSAFTGNNVGSGDSGAIDYAMSCNTTDPGGSMVLTQDTFTGNYSAGGEGGAVSANVTSDGPPLQVSVIACTFANNSAKASSGGGLYAFLQGSLGQSGTTPRIDLINDTFFQNSASHGAGMALQLAGNGPSGLVQSNTITGNTASTDGGGLWAWVSTSGSVLSVDNNIIDGNSVTAQGYNGPLDVTLASGKLSDQGYNLVGTSNPGWTAGGDQTNNTTGLANALANNGAKPGYPQTLALSNTSPGYRKGDQELTSLGNPFNLDERGLTRQAGKVSIGAEDPDAM
jgi:hypothetical protein